MKIICLYFSKEYAGLSLFIRFSFQKYLNLSMPILAAIGFVPVNTRNRARGVFFGHGISFIKARF